MIKQSFLFNYPIIKQTILYLLKKQNSTAREQTYHAFLAETNHNHPLQEFLRHSDRKHVLCLKHPSLKEESEKLQEKKLVGFILLTQKCLQRARASPKCRHKDRLKLRLDEFLSTFVV